MRIGTRSSALALTQAREVVQMLGGGEILTIKTSGDRGSGSDKTRWVDTIQDALLEGTIDLAVHSAKDLPGEMPDGLTLLGAPRRFAAHDVLCGAQGLHALRSGARVGSSSVRRCAQLRAAREDLDVVALAGNVDTRLSKLEDRASAGLDAIVLAHAGLRRLGRESMIGAILDVERFLPSPGQGALALQGRSDDEDASRAVGGLNDEDALACLLAERSLARELGASCHTPLGALAELHDDRLLLRGWVGLPDGSRWISDRLAGERSAPEQLGQRLAGRMRSVGAAEILDDAEHWPSGT